MSTAGRRCRDKSKVRYIFPIFMKGGVMGLEPQGELIPDGGGNPIPLKRDRLRVGRRQSCDIWLGFDNISAYHCELAFVNGVWQVVDLGSTNGTRVNGERIQKKTLRPGDRLSIGKRHYRIEYELPQNVDLDLLDEHEEDVMSKPLLERAGLVRRRRDDDEDDYNRRLLRQLMDDNDED
jgi:adenylate cyclase